MSAQAATLKLVATGTVSGGLQVGPTGVVDIGDAARFEYVFDSTAPNTLSSSGVGRYPDAFLSASARFGSVDVVATSGNTVEIFLGGSVLNNDTEISFSSAIGTTTAFGGPTQLNLKLVSYATDSIGSYALPTGPLDLSLFDIKQFNLGDSSVFANIDTLTITEVSAVPLPAGGLLLISAMGALAVTRRRRRA